MKTIVLVALLAAAGCSKKGSDCDASIAKGMDNFAASVKTNAANPQMQEARLGVIGKLRGTLTQRCNEDKWPAEVVTCFTTVASMKDMQACQTKLSDEQRTKLLNEVRQVMVGAMGTRMPPGAGHPPMLSPGGSGATEAAGGGMAGSAAAPAGSPAAPAGSAAPANPAAPAAGSAAAAPAPAAGSGAGPAGGW